MKKLLLPLFFLLFFLNFVEAQKKRESNQKNIPKTKRLIKNSFYFNSSYTSATHNFGADSYGLSEFIEKGSIGMGNGVGFEIGTIFYLHFIKFSKAQAQKTKLGIDVVYISVNSIFSKHHKDASYGTHLLAPKLGIILSHNLVNKLILDFKASIQPTATFLNNKYDENEANVFGFKNYYYFYDLGLSMRYGLGFQVRYKPYSIGINWSWGKTKMTNSYYNHSPLDDLTFNIPTNRFDLLVGLAF